MILHLLALLLPSIFLDWVKSRKILADAHSKFFIISHGLLTIQLDLLSYSHTIHYRHFSLRATLTHN